MKDLHNQIIIRILGAIQYDDAMRLQEEAYRNVRDGTTAGYIFLLEHVPPVITLGRRGNEHAILCSNNKLHELGYQVRKTSRGGFATVHEPGQAVIYFILPVEAKSTGYFVSHILHLVADFLKKTYSIIVHYDPPRPGLWWHGKKLCACGFDLTGGISRHGIAINVSNSLAGFSLIIPCGMRDIETTSVSRILHRPIECCTFINEFATYLHDKQRELY